VCTYTDIIKLEKFASEQNKFKNGNYSLNQTLEEATYTGHVSTLSLTLLFIILKSFNLIIYFVYSRMWGRSVVSKNQPGYCEAKSGSSEKVKDRFPTKIICQNTT